MDFLRNLVAEKMKQKDPNDLNLQTKDQFVASDAMNLGGALKGLADPNNYTGNMEDNRQMVSPRTGHPISILNMEENENNPSYFQKLKSLMGR